MSNSNFVDYVKICFRSGKGGAGSAHLSRVKYNPKAGPDGGNGGRGGDIILKGNSQLWTLLNLKYTKHVIAEDGGNGTSNCKFGAAGKDVIIEVPLGTIARDPDTGEIEAEIIEDGQMITYIPGGRGGLGNVNFKSPTNQAPTYAQPGEEGQDVWKILELKLLADVGLVGFPNAGKSTLLSVLSAARPEIANYAFTTLTPNLGLVKYRNYKSFVMADLPGLIEGAHEGKGLGIRFLRHVERNSMLLFVISAESENIKKDYEILLNELKEFNEEILHKKRLIAISKSELIDEKTIKKITTKLPKNIPFIFISSHTTKNLVELKDIIWKELNE
ncbi:MAG: GTPase ObgE [Bacteroidetes bacterium GWE2_29_8]|nr:MAG: GTPase ObgE [Bacteroidetes bacterium GWE2_29_8]OFY16178.1 MAG: GTPase ObgE [Bacteroidetes bacterium GWF2_29_10]